MYTLASVANKHNVSLQKAEQLLRDNARDNANDILDEFLAAELNNLRDFSVEVDYSTKLSEVIDYDRIKVKEIVFLSGADPKYRESEGNLLQYIEEKEIAKEKCYMKDIQIYEHAPRNRDKRTVKFSIVPVLPRKEGEFGRWDNSQVTTLAEIKRRKLRQATLRELVYFGNQYPYKHKKEVVVIACGTDIAHFGPKTHYWATLKFQEFKCSLDRWLHSDDERSCGYLFPDPEFEPGFRLLAVR